MKKKKLPVIDDAFVKALGKFENLSALRSSIEQGMLEEKKRARKEEWRTALLDTVVEETTLEYPLVLVQEELERMIRQFEGQVSMMGFTLENYLKQAKKTEEELRTEWTPQAKKRIAAELVLQKNCCRSRHRSNERGY